MALEHLRRGNAVGAERVWARARGRWRGLPDRFLGVGIGPWREALEALFAEVDLEGRVARQRAGEAAAALPPLERWPVPPPA